MLAPCGEEARPLLVFCVSGARTCTGRVGSPPSLLVQFLLEFSTPMSEAPWGLPFGLSTQEVQWVSILRNFFPCGPPHLLLC